MANRFDNLHVVVTGGTGALGSAVVQMLVAEGASIHVPVFHLSEIERFPLKSNPHVRLAPGIDLTADASAEGFYRDVPSLFSSIHIAGGFAMHRITETPGDELGSMWALNAVTAFIACREAVRRMRAAPAKRAGQSVPVGTIVNVAARPAENPALGAGMVAYTMAKTAVAALTRALAEEVRAEGIWVNAVLPSIMDTPANRASMPQADHAKWPRVEDVARAIVNLAAPDNALTSGALVPVYGRA